MTEAHYIANHMVKIHNNTIGVSMINTSNNGVSIGIGAPRIWSKPIEAGTQDYGEACDKFISDINATIIQLEAIRARFEMSQLTYYLTGEVPESV